MTWTARFGDDVTQETAVDVAAGVAGAIAAAEDTGIPLTADAFAKVAENATVTVVRSRLASLGEAISTSDVVDDGADLVEDVDVDVGVDVGVGVDGDNGNGDGNVTPIEEEGEQGYINTFDESTGQASENGISTSGALIGGAVGGGIVLVIAIVVIVVVMKRKQEGASPSSRRSRPAATGPAPSFADFDGAGGAGTITMRNSRRDVRGSVPVLNISMSDAGGAGSAGTLKTRIANSHSNATPNDEFKTFVRNPDSRIMQRNTSAGSGESAPGLMASTRRTNPLASVEGLQQQKGSFDWRADGAIAETSIDGAVTGGRPPSLQFPSEFSVHKDHRRSSDFDGGEAQSIMQMSPIASPTKLEPRNLPGVGAFPFDKAMSSESAYDHNDSTDEDLPNAPAAGGIDKTTGVNLALHFAGVTAGYAADEPTTDDNSDDEALPAGAPQTALQGGSDFESALTALGGGRSAVAAKKNKKKGIRGRSSDHQVTMRGGENWTNPPLAERKQSSGGGIRPRAASNQATRRGRDEAAGDVATQLGLELDASLLSRELDGPKPRIAAKPLGGGIRPRTAPNQATKRYSEVKIAKLPPGAIKPTPAPRPRMERRRSSLTGIEIPGMTAGSGGRMGQRRQSLCEEV